MAMTIICVGKVLASKNCKKRLLFFFFFVCFCYSNVLSVFVNVVNVVIIVFVNVVIT